jgi:hypothetical protein
MPLLAEMFYSHFQGLIAPHSHCEVTSAELSLARSDESNTLSMAYGEGMQVLG